jgi:uncharacterized protein (DUF169 family)
MVISEKNKEYSRKLKNILEIPAEPVAIKFYKYELAE